MRAPNIGEEFEKAVSGRKDEKVEGLEKRLAILSYLSRNPCCTSSDIAKAMNISDRGVLWHLRAMEKPEFIGELEKGPRRRFFIRVCLREGDCEVISLLKDARVRRILLILLERPGMGQKELTEVLNMSRQSTGKMLKRLTEAGILAETREGRNVRYYPTKKLSEIQKLYEGRREKASERIREIIESMGMQYEVILDRDGMLYLKIGDSIIRFGTDPVRSALEG